MRIIFAAGTDQYRHPHEAEPTPANRGLGRQMIALLLAAAFPIASSTAAGAAQPQSAAEQSPAPATQWLVSIRATRVFMW